MEQVISLTGKIEALEDEIINHLKAEVKALRERKLMRV